jgi:uncharacterized protein (TIGR02271 family)
MASDGEKKATGAGTVGGAALGGVAGGAAAGAAAGGLTGPAGAAIGAAVGAGIGAVSGKAAADGSGARGAGQMTVIGAFDDPAQAQRAVDRLVSDGFDRGDVHVERDGGATASQSASSDGEHQKHGGFFSWLFGDDKEHEQHRDTYSEAVRRGNSVVVVDVQDDRQAERAVACLHELGAVDVDQRAQQWRTEGGSDRQRAIGSADARGTDVRAGTSSPTAGEGVLDVVQEELQVGKRQLERGGVRVVQRISEKPVREVVRLREEHAVVERRPVDRQATAGDLNTFKEGTLEVRETAEEPVVAKTARVVEEVRVGKEVREREQTIEDTVRRKDVDVQSLDGSRTPERERAVASDTIRDETRERDMRDETREREMRENAERDASGRPRRDV